MNSDDVRRMLRRACDRAGSQKLWADANGVSAAYVSDVLLGRREPAEAICEPLGIERVVIFRKKRVVD